MGVDCDLGSKRFRQNKNISDDGRIRTENMNKRMVIYYWIDFEYKFKQFIFHYPALEFKEKKMLKPQ